jgi:biotin carboxylase
MATHLPRLAISYDSRSPSALRLAQAARDLCEVIWLVDLREEQIRDEMRLLQRLGTVLDCASAPGRDAADALAREHPSGIAAFNDRRLLLLSEVAQRLELRFNPVGVTTGLVDKLEQRRRLDAGGIAVPAFAEVRSGAARDDLARALVKVGTPAVLKPRSGSGSRGVLAVHDVEELAARMNEIAPETDDSVWILEAYLEGARSPGTRFADVVSVETLVQGGQLCHLAVTARLEFAPPFRETGSVLPSDVEPRAAEEVRDTAGAALRALRVADGFYHTEIKLTPDGPRVIEVNGRLGGYIDQLFAIASGGVSLTRGVMQVALGLDPQDDLRASLDRIAYVRLVTPPIPARRVKTIEGLEALREVEGVTEVVLNRRPGQPVSWRNGAGDIVLMVFGAVSAHDELHRRVEQIDETARVGYE